MHLLVVGLDVVDLGFGIDELRRPSDLVETGECACGKCGLVVATLAQILVANLAHLLDGRDPLLDLLLLLRSKARKLGLQQLLPLVLQSLKRAVGLAHRLLCHAASANSRSVELANVDVADVHAVEDRDRSDSCSIAQHTQRHHHLAECAELHRDHVGTKVVVDRRRDRLLHLLRVGQFAELGFDPAVGDFFDLLLD